MKNFAKRISALVLAVVVSAAVLCPAAFAAQLPSLPKDQCVVDGAGVLSSSTVQTITELNAQLESSCSGAQIGVLTVEYTGNDSTEDYATQAFNAWGIGSSSKNNGVLILLVMESAQYADGDYYLTYGDGFRNTTLAKQSSAIAQTMEDQFAARDYDGAVTYLCPERGKHHRGYLRGQPFRQRRQRQHRAARVSGRAEQRRQRPDRHPDPCGQRCAAHRHHPVDGLCFCQPLRLAVVLRWAAASSQTSRPAAAPAGRLLRRLWRHGRRLLRGRCRARRFRRRQLWRRLRWHGRRFQPWRRRWPWAIMRIKGERRWRFTTAFLFFTSFIVNEIHLTKQFL